MQAELNVPVEPPAPNRETRGSSLPRAINTTSSKTIASGAESDPALACDKEAALPRRSAHDARQRDASTHRMPQNQAKNTFATTCGPEGGTVGRH